MVRKCFGYIDDVIWVFRDLTRQRPASMFDNPFLKFIKAAHDKYGFKVQLNSFYRTDFFYGNDEFTLSDMTDIYKKEWEESSDWLKVGFHSKQEFPDYPYINAKYEDVKANFESMRREITRFACKNTLALCTIPHWNVMSREGCCALRDCGIKLLHATTGATTEYDGDASCLPYGHAARLLHNRQPETRLCRRDVKNSVLNSSICGYNHLLPETENVGFKNTKYHIDKGTGLCMKRLGNGPVLNHYSLDEIESVYAALIGDEYITIGNHEQYFYQDYFAYQPEYAQKLLLSAKILYDNGYEFIFAEDLV